MQALRDAAGGESVGGAMEEFRRLQVLTPARVDDTEMGNNEGYLRMIGGQDLLTQG